MAATYTHSPHLWRGPVTTFAGASLRRTYERLVASESLTVGLMGDSISEGYDASGFIGVAPFQPSYGPLLAEALQRMYGCSVLFRNFAVAGSTADNGMWESNSFSFRRCCRIANGTIR